MKGGNFAGLLLVLGLIVILSSEVSAIDVFGCTNINSPGVYNLQNDITANTGECMYITSSDVTLDCRGHTILDVSSYRYAIRIDGSSSTPLQNVEVRNCVMEGFDRSLLYADYAHNGTYEDLTFRGGIYSDDGMYLAYSEDNTMNRLDIQNIRGDGFEFNYVDRSRLTNSLIQNSSQVGIRVTGTSEANTIVGNDLINTENVLVSTTQAQSWDEFGSGNFYSNLAGTGYSDACSDSNNDLICDSSLVLDYGTRDLSYHIDNFPVAAASTSDAYSGGGTSLFDCTHISTPGTYFLESDITANTGECMYITSSDVTLDCRGHTILDVSSYRYAIRIDGSSSTPLQNVEVRNCVMEGFDRSLLYADYAHNGTYEDLTFRGGIYSDDGMYLAYSEDNTMNRLDIQNIRGDGFEFNYVDRSRLTNSLIQNSSQVGIRVTGTSEANTIVGNDLINTENVLVSTTQAQSWDEFGSGNFYSNLAGTGYSDACSDSNNDLICDSSLVLDYGTRDLSYHIDNFPVAAASTSDAYSGGGTSLFDCTHISTPGTYFLESDITANTGECMYITSSDVTLDCRGHTILDVSSYRYAIRIDGSSSTPLQNVEVRNCVMEGFDRSLLYADYAHNGTYEDLTFRGGIYSDDGMYLAYSEDNTMNRLDIQNIRGDGFEFNYVDRSRLTNSLIQNSSQVGIRVTGTSEANTIVGNDLINTENVLVSTTQAQSWDEFGSGNFYSNLAGTGYSDACSDSNNDLICDSSLVLDYGTRDLSYHIDNFPVAAASTSDAYSGGGTSLFDCTHISTPGTYFLESDITANTGECMYITSSDVTLDCRGHTILDVSSYRYAIRIDGSSSTPLQNVEVRNCVMEGFDRSLLYADYAHNGTYEDLTFRGGIYSDDGMYLAYSEDNTMNRLDIQNIRGDGFEFNYVDRSRLTNSLIQNSSQVGIRVTGTSEANKIFNNTLINDDNVLISTIQSQDWDVGGRGNYYGNLAGTGYSDLCSDIERNLICDSRLVLEYGTRDLSYHIDNDPLASPSTTGIYTGGGNSFFGCTHLSTPGTYFLESDIIASTGECIYITSSDVTLDCQNHKIQDVSSYRYAIRVDGSSSTPLQNVYVRNCVMEGFDRSQLYADYAHNSTYEDLTLMGGPYTDDGVYIAYSEDNVVNRINIQNIRGDGLEFNYADRTQLTSSLIQNSSQVGVRISGTSEDNLLFNNVFVNDDNTRVDSIQSNYWNNSLRGNYYGNDTNIDHSDTCLDVNADYICDTTFTHHPGVTDFFPLTQKSICGNGIIEIGESCDDYNVRDGDGCSSACQQVGSFSCLSTETLGDTTQETGSFSFLQTILDSQSLGIDAINDQEQTQLWRFTNSFDKGLLKVTFNAKGSAAYTNVFGYYLNNDFSTFVPLFVVDGNNPPHDTYPTLPSPSDQETFVISANAGDTISFAIDVETLSGDRKFYSTQNSVNFGRDRFVTYSLGTNSLLLSVEDAGDFDYEDMIVQVDLLACVTDALCGNGVVEIGEYCDDNNTNNSDGCSSFCTIELNPTIPPQTGNCTAGQKALCGAISTNACDAGIQACALNGTWGSCTYNTPISEICGDGVDNNCDGDVDEGCIPAITEGIIVNDVTYWCGANDGVCPMYYETPAQGTVSCSADPDCSQANVALLFNQPNNINSITSVSNTLGTIQRSAQNVQQNTYTAQVVVDGPSAPSSITSIQFDSGFSGSLVEVIFDNGPIGVCGSLPCYQYDAGAKRLDVYHGLSAHFISASFTISGFSIALFILILIGVIVPIVVIQVLRRSHHRSVGHHFVILKHKAHKPHTHLDNYTTTLNKRWLKGFPIRKFAQNS